MKKDLFSADRRLRPELSTALPPPRGDHLPENNANTEKGRDKEERVLSAEFKPLEPAIPEVRRCSDSKSQ